ncbi:TetR/AcrR family transcriptional regulator [Natrialba swarupiae]|uniref:TetR/AcrR family transcriptional regulator n=1 Tax=Natrialba swarupiae TaxID=2448032 RepID=A0A5D5APK0_9EURY|nr:TetR/AcrR family transcriptional regulator [Natrialba swarupiae]TYT62847.1 TetR/AcrR family transcriptional regulator [Natrialba swarupiae]
MSEPFFSDPEGTREQILAATYRALSRHGYADLTISAIGEEFEKSPSLVYRHYDSKDDLVLACLSYMLDQFETRFTDEEITDPRCRLESFLGWGLVEDLSDEEDEFIASLVELRSLAVHDDDYGRHFSRSDRVFERHLATILRAGIDQGVFQDRDPDRVAVILNTLMFGSLVRRATQQDTDQPWIEHVRAELATFLETQVYADGVAVRLFDDD